MRILHLSDIHIPSENDRDFNPFILNPFLLDISKFNKQKNFDLVILSGDLIDKGGISFQNRDKCYDIFLSCFVEPILKTLSLSRDRFYFVPGNHDVWRDKDSEIVEAGLSQLLKNSNAVNKFIDDASDDGIKRVEPFKKFENEFHKEHTYKLLTNYHSLFKIQVGENTLGIACLNTAWRSHNEQNDKRNLILGERQLSEAKDFFTDTNINIALLHHPVDWLADFDRKCVEPLLENLFRLVFCGHVHSASSWVKSDIYNGVFISVAPPNWKYGIHESEGECHNGYSIIDFDAISSEVQVISRRFSYNKQAFVPNNDLGDNEGVSKLQLPTPIELKQQHDELKLSSAIRNRHYEVINEHLLTYNTDTKAPQELQNIFVFPRIVEKVQFESENKQKEKPLSVDEICAYPANQIIFGVKEAGKTILLDSMLMHFNDNIRSLRSIPVYIDFRHIGNTKIESIISRYLGIGLTAAKEMIGAHKVVLLVDNLSFNADDFKQLSSLEEFLKSTAGVKMIGTSIQSTEGILPADLFEYPFFTSFRKLHIKAFGSTETRHLIKNWFSKNPSPDIEGKIEKLIDTLLTLNLPRTPLAISMFLWILEQQENYKPINNATMLENFIEKLFSKHSRKEIYSGRFDFHNKVRLLAEIAHFMFDKDQVDYRLSSREIIDFIDDKLKAKKFDFIQTKDVLDHFLTKGVLVEELESTGSYVRFRFGCFMHYFLMKKMDYDVEFKNFVLDDKNYLMFTDEIDFYTGLKRDSSDILVTVVKRMTDEFRSIIEKINAHPDTFDGIFETHQSIVSSIGENFLTRLSETPKPTQSEIDAARDDALEKAHVEKGIKKIIHNLSKRKRMELLWTLAAMVLKNTEETTVPDLKYNAYCDILKCSMAYAILWKVNIERYIAENEKKEGFRLEEEVDVQRHVLPIIHQLWLMMLLGTTKLSVVFQEKIKADEKDSRVSDFEKFISVFIYSDIKGRNCISHMRTFVRNVHSNHLVNMTLFKLLSYYFLRSKTKEVDKQYENLIGDLIVHAKGLSKVKKGKIIQDYRNRRKKETKRISKKLE